LLKIKILEGRKEIDREIPFQEGMTYYDLLEAVRVNPETAVVTRGGIPVPCDDTVATGDISVVRLASAG